MGRPRLRTSSSPLPPIPVFPSPRSPGAIGSRSFDPSGPHYPGGERRTLLETLKELPPVQTRFLSLPTRAAPVTAALRAQAKPSPPISIAKQPPAPVLPMGSDCPRIGRPTGKGRPGRGLL